MKMKNLKNFIRKSATFVVALFFVISCQKEQDNLNENAPNKDPNLARLGVPEFSESYLKSIDPLSPVEYQQKISKFRPDIKDARVARATVPSSYYVPAPPVGNQGNEGSCVGWGIGYAGHSITRYINNTCHNKSWSSANRSASYIYNQIKINNCANGSYPQDAMNLLYNKGECSNAQMPYVNGGCYTLPTATQNSLAAQRKIAGWRNISATNVEDWKYYLSQKYPIPVCFDYNQSFTDISRTGYVWSQVYGTRNGGHCVCVVGYDDATQRFKVINSWGSGWGISGYFYVTYGAVRSGAFNWAAVMFPNVQANQVQSNG